MRQDELKVLIEDLRLNHEYCPKEIILQAADELERLAQTERPAPCVRHCEATAFQIVIKNLKVELKQALAQTQEPVAWATKDDFYRELERRLKHIREEMKIKSVTMRCKEYDIALPIIDTDFGRVLVGQVSTPPQRTWVDLTNDEIALIHADNPHPQGFARAILAKSKEKNT